MVNFNTYSSSNNQNYSTEINLRQPNLSPITRAIRELKIIEFFYNGHRRIFEPHACGTFSTGNTLLVGWQEGGSSTSGKVPAWKNFNLSKIRSLTVTNNSFVNPRFGYNPNDQRFKFIYASL